jgi:hypothetical protein
MNDGRAHTRIGGGRRIDLASAHGLDSGKNSSAIAALDLIETVTPMQVRQRISKELGLTAARQ